MTRKQRRAWGLVAAGSVPAGLVVQSVLTNQAEGWGLAVDAVVAGLSGVGLVFVVTVLWIFLEDRFGLSAADPCDVIRKRVVQVLAALVVVAFLSMPGCLMWIVMCLRGGGEFCDVLSGVAGLAVGGLLVALGWRGMAKVSGLGGAS